MSLNALYVDFNSYFASVEQQLVPQLRGKPVGVLAVMAETTCCIAASYEAKAFGVKTGTSVRDARALCPDIIFVEARPAIYVEYHHKLISIVESCSHVEKVLSIDEMVCKLTGSQQHKENALKLASHIKRTLANQAGEYIRCSIGIAPNTFLAKVASNMQKPDGCTVIEAHELPHKLYSLKPRDLNGIGKQMEARLNRFGLNTVASLYAANKQQLRAAWGSIEGERMYDKLRGVEVAINTQDRKSLGHSHVLAPELRTPSSAHSVLHRLLQKACMRLRSYQLHTAHISLRIKFIDQATWLAESACSPTDDTLALTHALEQLWLKYPQHQGTPYAVGISFNKLLSADHHALDLFSQPPKHSQQKLSNTLDQLNMRFGKNTVYFGAAHKALSHAPMRIAFNHIPDLVIESDNTE